jgi:hypothetical protein
MTNTEQQLRNRKIPDAATLDDYYALISNGMKRTHVVDPTTFRDNISRPQSSSETPVVGVADALCGAEVVGAFTRYGVAESEPLCQTCLRALRAREVDDE